MSQPLVSVIIPSYYSMTGTKNIDKTLRSIFNQTYKNIEVLVIDNFSRDLTSNVCRNYPIRFFQKDGTRSQARNYGLKEIKGDYVFFIDSDHELAPTVVEDCVAETARFHADCIIVPVVFVNKKKTLINCSKMRNLEFQLKLGTQTLILFYAKNIVEKIEFPENVELGEDAIFSSMVLQCKPRVGKVKSCIYHMEDGSVRNLISRSWSYGGKFKSTISEIGPRESARFILSISPLGLKNSNEIVRTISNSSENLYLPLYELLKHSSFGISYAFSYLTGLTKRN